MRIGVLYQVAASLRLIIGKQNWRMTENDSKRSSLKYRARAFDITGALLLCTPMAIQKQIEVGSGQQNIQLRSISPSHISKY